MRLRLVKSKVKNDPKWESLKVFINFKLLSYYMYNIFDQVTLINSSYLQASTYSIF